MQDAIDKGDLKELEDCLKFTVDMLGVDAYSAVSAILQKSEENKDDPHHQENVLLKFGRKMAEIRCVVLCVWRKF